MRKGQKMGASPDPRLAGTLLKITLALAAMASVGHAHTWLFTRGRATMQASLTKPFRQRMSEAGQVRYAAKSFNF